MDTSADALVVATPGSGKTTMAAEVASQILRGNLADRVVVVVPTTALRTQVADSFARRGIQLDPSFNAKNGRERDGYVGVVVTYSAVSERRDVYFDQCQRSRTFVILDEIHHAADQSEWGAALAYAFGGASRRLLMSGSPWRSNPGESIPFVQYDNDGNVIKTFEFTYKDAVEAGVCRPVNIRLHDGTAIWQGPEDITQIKVSAPLTEAERSKATRTILTPEFEWMQKMMRDADARLLQIRSEGHANAAGLVIATDKVHAKSVAAMMSLVLGYQPAVVLSDEEGSHRHLQNFAKATSTDRWVVAVRMVSEGIDIPRLRVLVYATNIRTMLFVDQAVGRTVRVIAGEPLRESEVFVPDEPWMQDYARGKRIDVKIAMEGIKRKLEEGMESNTATTLAPSQFTPIGASDHGVSGSIGLACGKERTPEMIRAYTEYRNSLHPDMLAVIKPEHIWHAVDKLFEPVAAPATVVLAAPEPLHQEERRLRTERAKLVGSWASDLVKAGWEPGMANKEINSRMWKVFSLPVERLSIGQLRAQLEYLRTRVA